MTRAETMLDRARVALEGGDLGVALPLLIAQWRERPARELGDLIDQVDDRLELPEFRGDWIEVARAPANELARGPLIRAIRKRTLEETERFLALAIEWRDPRLTRVLLSLLVELPWTGRRSRAGWRQIFRAMARHRDPRLFERACTLPPTWTVGEEMQELLSEQLATSIFEIEVPPWPEAAALGALVGQPAIMKAAPPETEEELLARIYEQPEDDAARAVYADCLLEREDPHGEFIALQLRATKDDDAKREAALLSKHRKAWLGPLASVLRDVEFRRGFPAVATVKFRHQRDVDQHGHHAAWATIEELSWTHSQALDDRLEWSRALTPAMHGLRVVHDPSLSQLLTAPRPWGIQRLQCRSLDAKQFHALIDHPLLPALQTLAMGSTPKPSWFNGISKCPPHLEMNVPLDSIDREAFVTKAESTPVETLTFVWSYYRACYSRDDAGKLSRLDVATTIARPSFDVLQKPTIATIDSALKQIKFRSLSHVEVTATIAGEKTSISHLLEQTKRIRR